jgi:hypothetical protein
VIPERSGRDRPLDPQHPLDESRRCASASFHRPLDPRGRRRDALHRPTVTTNEDVKIEDAHSDQREGELDPHWLDIDLRPMIATED